MSYVSAVDQMNQTERDSIRLIIRRGLQHLQESNPSYYDVKDTALLVQLAVNIQILRRSLTE